MALCDCDHDLVGGTTVLLFCSLAASSSLHISIAGGTL
jgi:hypothetical protein